MRSMRSSAAKDELFLAVIHRHRQRFLDGFSDIIQSFERLCRTKHRSKASPNVGGRAAVQRPQQAPRSTTNSPCTCYATPAREI